MPGEVDLKERLRVGRDTVRLALEMLEKEGWLESSAQGRKRRIHPEKLPHLKRHGNAGLPVTLLSPYPIDQGQTQLEMEETQKLGSPNRDGNYNTSTRRFSISKIPGTTLKT